MYQQQQHDKILYETANALMHSKQFKVGVCFCCMITVYAAIAIYVYIYLCISRH